MGYAPEYNKPYFKTWYLRNKDKQYKLVKARSAKQKQINREFVDNYLKNNPCVDCGYSDIRALEFDHVRGNKIKEISTMICCYSLTKIIEEIKKCDVRCANCHRIITKERKQY